MRSSVLFLIVPIVIIVIFLVDVTKSAEDEGGGGKGVGVVRRGQENRRKLVRSLMRNGTRKREGAVRLVDGSNPYEGRVEIFHVDRWGSICDDEWDEREAKVVCHQLGYTTSNSNIKIDIRATHNGKFGGAREKYWLDNLLCDGTEKNLTECRHDGWGTHDCTDQETAGVMCAKENPSEEDLGLIIPTPTPEISRPRKKIEKVEVKLAGGRLPTEGRVLVRLGDSEKWGLICGDGWSLLEGSVICRQLGLGYAQLAPQTDYFGGDFEDVVTTGVKCGGKEGELGECFHHDVQTNNGNETGEKIDILCPGNKRNFGAVICTEMLPDLVPDPYEVQRSAYLEDKQLYFLQCSMEENCLASSAYRHQAENNYGWHLEMRRLLRFTAKIVNSGNADFRPAIPKHLWQFHACHMHYHSMEVFAVFDVLDVQGRKIAEGHKASFCLEDNECVTGSERRYACANYGDQGISVGCADIYRSNIDCQWIDVTDILPGQYTFKISINTEMKVAEQDFSNNAVLCDLHYSEAAALITNCTLSDPF